MPRKVISNNEVQFISGAMQKMTHCKGISHCLIPLYHPASNPVERKNWNLKTLLGSLVGNRYEKWDQHVGAIRFARPKHYILLFHNGVYISVPEFSQGVAALRCTRSSIKRANRWVNYILEI